MANRFYPQAIRAIRDDLFQAAHKAEELQSRLRCNKDRGMAYDPAKEKELAEAVAALDKARHLFWILQD